MLVIIVIGIVAGIGIPTLQQLMPGAGRREFASRFNQLVSVAWQNALQKNKVHRIWVDIEKRMMRVEVETDEITATGEPKFVPLEGVYVETTYKIPENITLKQFYVEGEEKIQQRGVKVEAVWFYIVPDGLSQDVIINFFDTREKDNEGNPAKGSLVVNPFTSQTRVYGTYQKP